MHLKGSSSMTDKVVVTVAEFIGTAILLFMGCMGSTAPRNFFLLESSLAWGLAVMIAMECFGHVSGAHINPIVSMAAVITGSLPLVDCLLYVLGQFLGAICGFGFLKLLLPDEFVRGTCSLKLFIDVDQTQGLFIEFMISFILVFTVCGIWDYKNRLKNDSTSLRCGFTIAALLMGASMFTGASLNPARALAPAIINNYWTNHWIYWVGDLLGAAIAAVLYVVLFTDENTPQEVQGGKSGEVA